MLLYYFSVVINVVALLGIGLVGLMRTRRRAKLLLGVGVGLLVCQKSFDVAVYSVITYTEIVDAGTPRATLDAVRYWIESGCLVAGVLFLVLAVIRAGRGQQGHPVPAAGFTRQESFRVAPGHGEGYPHAQGARPTPSSGVPRHPYGPGHTAVLPVARPQQPQGPGSGQTPPRPHQPPYPPQQFR